MAVPKLRFKADDGSDYPDLEETKLDTLMAFKNGINARVINLGVEQNVLV